MSVSSSGKNQYSAFNNVRELYTHLGLPVDDIDENADFAIHDLKDIHAELPYASPVFRPNFFSFVFVKDAYGRYTTDDLEFDTLPGTIYFTNPGHYKSFNWHTINETCLITLSESFLKKSVHADIFDEFPFLLAETVRPKVLSPEAYTEFENIYLQIRKEYVSEKPYRMQVIGSLFVVLLLRIKEHFWKDYNPIYEGNRSSQIVLAFKRMLEKHYRDLRNGLIDRMFRVQDYADAQQLHPNYLSTVIKIKTGKPIGAWISEKTIAQAKFLLQDSKLSIKDIAFQLGFAEANYFSIYFKKYTQMTPALFRKQHNTPLS